MTALEKLTKKNQEGKFICVGLDTDINKIPEHLLDRKNPVLEFNKLIIEKTFSLAAAYKLNFAFYEDSGASGYKTLKETLQFIPADILTIGDAKRGDIGNTAEKYADSVYNYFKFDSTTLNPYMGYDSLSPFLRYEDKLNFILALTSNPGAADFQKLKLSDGDYLFQSVIKKINLWDDKKNCGLVFGATQASELRENISLIGQLPVLIPGVGKQGGSLKEVVNIFTAASRKNFLINMSRNIIYADNTVNFSKASAKVLRDYNTEVSILLDSTL